MRIPKRYLEHRVILEAVKRVPTSIGPTYQAPRTVSALVSDKRRRVVDQRLGSETKGEEITSNGSVLLQPEDLVPAGSIVTLWAGTELETRRTVMSTRLGRSSIAPQSAQLFLE